MLWDDLKMLNIMKFVNGIAALVLALFSTFMGLFYLGSKEQHDQAVTQHLWQTLALRIAFASSVGLVGAAVCWGVNVSLLKSHLVKSTELHGVARLLIASVLLGTLVGSSLFCFL